jgi:hypothetical protein
MVVAVPKVGESIVSLYGLALTVVVSPVSTVGLVPILAKIVCVPVPVPTGTPVQVTVIAAL